MLKQRGKQLSALDSQLCLQEEERHLLDQSANIHQDKQSTNPSHKSSREDRALQEKMKIAGLIVEAEFMEKRQTLEQQAQRLKIATEVAKSKARIKLLENKRKFNGKVDTASTFPIYPAKSKTSIVEIGIC